MQIGTSVLAVNQFRLEVLFLGEWGSLLTCATFMNVSDHYCRISVY